MASSAEDSNNRVEAVLRLGERNGFLTYQMLNELLPDEMVTPTKLDSILIEINERRIRLIDETLTLHDSSLKDFAVPTADRICLGELLAATAGR